MIVGRQLTLMTKLQQCDRGKNTDKEGVARGRVNAQAFSLKMEIEVLLPLSF